MKKTPFFPLGVLVLTIALFTACKDGNDTHTHTWGAWQSNATQHWKECTAHDGAEDGRANHTGNTCTVCGYETPVVPNPATITQGPPNGLAFEGTMKISTSDLYLEADWDAVVANVITAFNAAYEAAPSPGKTRFRNVFGNDAGAQIVLVNNLANNWEVRDNEFKTLYLKTGSIATADYETAVNRMNANAPEVG